MGTELDTILTEVGEFGLYQVIIYFLLCIPSALSATFVVNYMFSANPLNYRCKVAECDVGEHNRDIPYNQQWVNFAIPTTSNGKLKNCVRYASIKPSGGNIQCQADKFNTSNEIECTEYIYETDEKNLQTELNIHCSDTYKLGLVGTVNNIGRFIFLPMTGLLSDKYGRLTVFVIGMSLGSVVGLIKSFSYSYWMYICFEFLESISTSTFGGIYVLGIEWVNSKYRILGCVILALSFSIGEIMLGFAAFYVHDFRNLMRIFYTPGLFLIVYFWLVPESVRWLLVKGNVDRATGILKRTARVNGKELSEKSIESMKLKYSSVSKINNLDGTVANDNPSLTQSISSILRSRTLCFRLLVCCYQWTNCCFCYYGLSLMATHVPGKNRYVSFMTVAAIEIPGVLITLPLLNRMKRRPLLFGVLTITAFSTFATAWIPKEHSTIVLLFFMLGKMSITCAFNSVYIFTAEQWPTNVRTTIANFCSMVGRLGSMVAPMTAILATHFDSLPVFLFSGSAMLGAILIWFCPETFNKKLPDTVEDSKTLK